MDLSKKQVTKNEIEECLSKFANCKSVHSIMRSLIQVNKKLNMQFLYETIVWPLYDKQEYEHPIHVFRSALDDSEKAFEGITMAPELKKLLIEEISRRLTP